jgi:hypothetical protein
MIGNTADNNNNTNIMAVTNPKFSGFRVEAEVVGPTFSVFWDPSQGL